LPKEQRANTPKEKIFCQDYGINDWDSNLSGAVQFIHTDAPNPSSDSIGSWFSSIAEFIPEP